MNRHVIAGLLLGMAMPALAAPALSVVISHETGSVGADGVTRISQYRERMVRDDGHVWTQRLLPANAQKPLAHEQGHAHPDFTLAGRLVTPAAGGKADLAMVLPGDGLLVTLSPVDYEEQGFQRCWACARHLVAPAELARMRVTARRGTLVSYERSDGNALLKVVWDAALQLPREIDERRRDGSRWARTVLTPQAAPATLPWLAAARYQQRTMGDFGD